jgi:hypothetical protein
MARKRKSGADLVPEHAHEFEHRHKTGRGRRLLLLLALAGGVAFVVRRKQQRAELDEGVWHEAPA